VHGVGHVGLADAQLSQPSAMASTARRNHRSMQEQARLLIEREVGLSQVVGLERARQWRTHSPGARRSPQALLAELNWWAMRWLPGADDRHPFA